MIIFYTNFGGGGLPWQAGPILMIITLLFNMGILQEFPDLIESIFFLAVCIGIAYFVFRTIQQHNAQQPANATNNANNRRTANMNRTYSERLSAVADVINKLPIEIYHTKEELQKMSIHELKNLLEKTGKSNTTANYIEKDDIIEQLLVASINSSSESCTICCEDYQAGDALRVLRCSHAFHIECIDRWCLSMTDYTRPAACPLCNKELEAT